MTALIQAKHIYKSYKGQESNNFVLENVNLTLHEGEIVALLGKSGSGKSTLLRIIAGLIPSSAGEIYYREKLIKEPVPGISMVFQHFALLPWLNVLQNVELGLEAQGVPKDERRTRAIAAIDTIGMDGFESAYPKELSGGMRQRVGFARALVVNPDLLIMDEPFSALDVLTAENLKSDLLDLWQQQKTNIRGMLLVTHNIEEAAMLANRVLIFGNNPGYVRAELKIDLPFPRSAQSPELLKTIDKIYTLMTTSHKARFMHSTLSGPVGIGHRLPDISPSELNGLMETMDSEFKNQSSIDLPKLADSLMMDVDNLFPITEALELLKFAQVSHGDIQLTEAGKQYIGADILERKKLFARQLINHIPLAKEIRRILDEDDEHKVPKDKILHALSHDLSEKESERVLKTAIDWGRYAELFAYHDDAGALSLENPN